MAPRRRLERETHGEMLRRARYCARFPASTALCGTAFGKIHAFRPVSGAEDMGTLQKVANEMERLGYGRSAEEFAKTGLVRREIRRSHCGKSCD